MVFELSDLKRTKNKFSRHCKSRSTVNNTIKKQAVDLIEYTTSPKKINTAGGPRSEYCV